MPPSPAPHHHGRSRAGHGPAEVGGDFDVLRLAAAALAIVISVAPLAVGADRARVVGIVAQLAHVLDHHVDAVGVALAQMATAGVVGASAAEPAAAVAHVIPTFALLAKTVVLELQHRREGERVIGASHVHVLGADAGVGPEYFACIAAGDRRDRPMLIMHVHARLVAAADHAADEHQRMAAVARALGAGDDDGVGVVGLDAAVETDN